MEKTTSIPIVSQHSGLTAAVGALHAALDERDEYTRLHSDRVVTLATELGAACGIPLVDMPVLRLAAQFHDIGKIGVPDNVLKKPGPLTQEEWVLMRSHTVRGERIFRATGVPIADRIAPIIRHHHEVINGTGYPDGLQGEEIPLMSRILAVADAYDAMTTTRPYREALTHRQSLDFIELDKGVKFDTEIVGVFFKMVT